MIAAPDQNGRETHVATLGQGEYRGAYAPVDSATDGASLRAASQVEVLAIGAASLRGLLDDCPVLRDNLDGALASGRPRRTG